MSASAVVLLVVVCSLIWGGFGALLTRAVREEAKKASGRIDEHPPHPSP